MGKEKNLRVTSASVRQTRRNETKRKESEPRAYEFFKPTLFRVHRAFFADIGENRYDQQMAPCLSIHLDGTEKSRFTGGQI